MESNNKITLNCDMGESFGLYKMGDDNAMLRFIDIANVACGFHASDYTIMHETVLAAKENGVKVGAHPSYPDLQGFGRREMKLNPAEVKDAVIYQVGALKGFIDCHDMSLNHIKPHGSLYGVTARDESVCKAIVEVAKSFGVPFVGMAGTMHESVAKQSGVKFIAEFFADLDYTDDGKLIITRHHEARDPQHASTRVQQALETGMIGSINGKLIPVKADTICVHSDTPGTVKLAEQVRDMVRAFNIQRCLSRFGATATPKILIANRGEIACRVIKTAQRMKLKTVAIYEPEDECAQHVKMADESVELHVGSGYMSIDSIVDICLSYKVDCVHPGYGFLSESHLFARAVSAAGITFLGPSAETIETFGLKHRARELAIRAGVPVTPGTGLLENVETCVIAADRMGYPVMLKATGGGGGIGMHVCSNVEEIRANFESCRSLAVKHFGNGDVYLEKYYPNSRHIEVQIFGDGKGTVKHLGERECSVQRRNQKVIEETPSPFLSDRPEIRKRICDAAVTLASSVNYKSAGTVEFLTIDEGDTNSDTGKFFFLEMNTRLQVEHGVTELTNEVDLVEWMIMEGFTDQNFEFDDFLCSPKGHAIEARVYAENPARNFQPSPGMLTEVKWPDDVKSPHLRIDTWVQTGTNISSKYDPLIAKVIVWQPHRKSAIDKMLDIFNNTVLAGPMTNVDYLQAVLDSDLFRTGRTTTKILQHIPYSASAVEVIRGGMETTIQDLPGRMALRVYGINPSGPMDDLAFRMANILVGNHFEAPALEIIMKGPQIRFHTSCRVSFTGALYEITLQMPDEQEVVNVPMWSEICVPKGAMLDIGKILKNSRGCRGYMAIKGGFQLPEFLGSKSTFPAFGFGGFQGRKLQAGDMLPVSSCTDASTDDTLVKCQLPDSLVPKYAERWHIPVMVGPHAAPDYITEEGLKELTSADWKVHYNSNRMGIRLVGPVPKWARPDGGGGGSHPSNIHDSAYALGSINFTGDSPVILTVEGPTQGGFVCPFTILSNELWKTGQLAPGDTVNFHPVSFAKALEIRAQYDCYMAQVTAVRVHYPIPVPLDKCTVVLDGSSFTSSAQPNNPAAWSDLLKTIVPDEKLNRPKVQYRPAGDTYLMVEYGDPLAALNLNLRARIKALHDALRLHTDTVSTKVSDPLIPGTIDAAPCIRSLLIRYDPLVIHQSTLVGYLEAVEYKLPDCSALTFPSRIIHMPLAFDDRWCKEATEKYMNLVRHEASYLPSNVDFIAQNNGLTGGKTEVCQAITGSPWLVVGVGFYVGCPFMVPVHPLHRLNVPKYNPARTYTAAGTVGLGGSFSAIYPLESPGGYQMFGRTVPTWDTFGTTAPFKPHQPWLLQMFDQVVFHLVSEEKLLELRKLALAGKYEYRIEESVFDMKLHNDDMARLKDQIEEFQQKKKEASAKMLAIENNYLKEQIKSAPSPDPVVNHLEDRIPSNHVTCEAGMFGVVKHIGVAVGKEVVANQTIICALEAMKTEVNVVANESGTVTKILVNERQQVSADTTVCILRKP